MSDPFEDVRRRTKKRKKSSRGALSEEGRIRNLQKQRFLELGVMVRRVLTDLADALDLNLMLWPSEEIYGQFKDDRTFARSEGELGMWGIPGRNSDQFHAYVPLHADKRGIPSHFLVIYRYSR